MIDLLIFGEAQTPDQIIKRKPQKSNEKLIYNLINRNFTSIDPIKMHSKPKSKDLILCKLFYCNVSHQNDEFDSLIEINKREIPEKYLNKLKFDHFISIGMYEDAINTASQIGLITSLNFALRICFCLHMLRDLIKLQEYTKKFKELFPSNSSHFDLCYQLANLNYRESIGIIDESLQDSLLSLKVFCLMKLNQFNSAVDLVNQCLEKNNSNEFIWNYADSFYCFSNLLRFQPDKPEYLFNLSKLYAKRQNFELSEKILKKLNKDCVRFDNSMELIYPLLDLTEANSNHYSYLGPYKVVPEHFREMNSIDRKAKKSKKNDKKCKKITESRRHIACKNHGKEPEELNENYYIDVLASLKSPVKRPRRWTKKPSKYSSGYKKSK